MTFLLYALGFLAILVLTQDLQVFPALATSIFKRPKRDPSTLPPGIESFFVETEDGCHIEVWRLATPPDRPKQSYVGVVFHGNGGTLEHFLFPMLWFQEQGITCYSFDYRGFGHSSGWPSESGVYRDSEAVCAFALEQENLTPDEAILLGISVGGAPAAYMAEKLSVKTLVLVAAFTDIKRVIREQIILAPLSPFCRYRFPTIDYIRGLDKTSLVVGHGERDKTVRVSHSHDLISAYSGSGQATHLLCPETGHNAAFFSLKDRIKDSLELG